MNNTRQYNRTAAFLLSLIFLVAQSFILTMTAQTAFRGKVVDEAGNPITEAVAFRLAENAAILGTSVADSVGTIAFDEVFFDSQKETVRVTAFGYQDVSLTANPEAAIVLKPLAVGLEEIVVKGEAQVVQRSDGLTFKVANTGLVKASKTSLELLKMTPLIREDENKKLSVLGKASFVLYINGRKTNLSEDAIQSYLQSLPPENVINIEVITNPGVTESIRADQGIVNLVLKKNDNEGIKGNLSLQDGQKRKNSQDGNLYLDIQKGKFSMSANVYGFNNNYVNDNYTDYYYETGKMDHNDNDVDIQNWAGGGNVRMDYRISDNHTLGVVLDALHTELKTTTDGRINYFADSKGADIDSIYNSWNDDREIVTRVATNLNYRIKVSDLGSTLAFDFDYLRNNKDHKTYNDYKRLATSILPESDSQFREFSGEKFNNYSAKAEYMHVFNERHNLTGGVEFSRTSQDADFSHTNIWGEMEVPDESMNNYFEYDEMLTMGYLSYNWSINEKLAGSAGFRLENAKVDGLQRATGETIDRHDFDFVPNFSIVYSMNQDNRFSYNLMSTVDRPGFYSLNPFQFFISPNTFKAYNSGLKTGRTYIQTLDYSLKGNYFVTLNYIHGIDVTNNFYIPVDEKYTKLVNANYGNTDLVMLNLAWNQAFFDSRLYLNVSAMGLYQRCKGSVESIIIDTKGFSGEFRLGANVLISERHNWSMSLNGSYMSPAKLAQEDFSSLFNIAVGAKKVFPKDIALNFGVTINNFHDIRQKAYSNYRYYTNVTTEPVGAYVSISVPFGNMKVKGTQSRSSSSIKTRLKE